MTSTVIASINLADEGKATGYLKIGDSTNNSGWATFCVPIIKIKNGKGPTVLVLAGNHGDEYEGQFAAADLAHTLEISDVTGRIIIIPCLSQQASKAGNRLWNTGVNFNRSFPGDENGSVSDKLAYYITHDLLPMVDAVMDIHSGGRGHFFIPCSHMVWARDKEQRQRMFKTMTSWNTTHHLIFPEQPGTDPYSLLVGEAERQGKDLFTTELGGAGIATFETTQLGKLGVRNALRHYGVLKGQPKSRVESGQSPPIFLDMRGPHAYHSATHTGLYENIIGLGKAVKKGEVVGLIHEMDHPDTPAVKIFAQQNGVVGVMRGFPRVTPGDVVAVIGKAYSSVDEIPENI